MTDPSPTLLGRLLVALQYVIPHHLVARPLYRLARVRWRPLSRALNRAYVRVVGIDMAEAAEPDPDAYSSLNALFTRALRPDARPLDPDPAAVLSPVDGTLSQAGTIRDGRIVQAKGHLYSALDLLGDPVLAERYDGGAFAALYLSPKDYHRVHMPVGGRLSGMSHIPGRLFNVNGLTAALVPGLFARNERLLCRFETEIGPLAMVLVGATFVGGIETVWAGEVTPIRTGRAERTRGSVELDRGAEMGRFNLGSTVILLFPPGTVEWDRDLQPGCPVRVGRRIGTLRN